jgi:hypothetical protein
MKYELKNKKVWVGGHKGVGFEIVNWTTPPNSIDINGRENWNYYIIIHLDRIPEQYKPNSFWLRGRKSGSHVFYDYYKHPVIGSIEFHGGCTWYSKEHGFDGSARIIKIGCDYSHYWDEGHVYNLQSVLIDVKNTIEDFRNRVAKYKYRCNGNGKLYDLEDGVLKDEQFYSKDYYGEQEWFKVNRNLTLKFFNQNTPGEG